MRLPNVFLIPGVFFLAALLALLAAWSSVGVIERMSQSAVEKALILKGQDWAHVETDGLQLILTGTAPSESDRFRAITIAGGEIDASRVIDRMEVPSSEALRAPHFSVEILRNDAGISMIGLIPAATDREALTRRVSRITVDREVADFLETADYETPDGWDEALDFAIFALEELPRSKISIDAQRVEIEAISDSLEQKQGWEQALARRAPGGLRMVMNISAPRPVITPFTARFVIDDAGARFDACAAGTDAGRTRIVAAGIAAGVNGQPDCTVGLGEPSPDWPQAVALGVAAVRELGAGTITYSDADVTLVAPAEVEQRNFDRVVGELEADLPEVFSLHASRTQRTDGSAEGPPEFTATLSPEGQVQLRGLLADEQERSITESVARARFGMDKIYPATRLDQNLPQGWSVRVLAAIEALSFLDNGIAIVQPDLVELRGKTGDSGANAEISRLLSEKLGEAQDFRVNVIYDEALDPIAQMPSPEECVTMINDAIRASKITFAPGSVEIDAISGGTIDKIADYVKQCPDAPMEIGGHTDSQGSEEMNKSLSQQRANSVLNALLARRVLTSNLTAHGYGEEQPVADNDTEEGREENRRIEFRLIGTADLPNIGPDGEDLGEPIVVDPELRGKRPRPRPTGETAAAGDDEATDEPDEEETLVEDGSGDGMPIDETGSGDDVSGDEMGSGDDMEPVDDMGSGDDLGSGDMIAEDMGSGDDLEPLAEPDAAETDAADKAVPAVEDTVSDEVAEATEDVASETTETATENTTDEASAEEPTDENLTEAVAEPAADTVEEENDGEEIATEEPLGEPIVVDPDLEGIKAPPRPE